MDQGTFAAHFAAQALRSARVAGLFEDSDLSRKPGQGSMSTGEQIQHILASQNFVRGLLGEVTVTNALFERQFDVSTVAAALGGFRQMLDEVRAAAAHCPPERWREEIAPWGEEWRGSRGSLAYLMIEHEVHHTGQLHVYLRCAGKTPTFLYDAVDEGLLGKQVSEQNKG
jgi:uncharacterized damage-inducible protein DinB